MPVLGGTIYTLISLKVDVLIKTLSTNTIAIKCNIEYIN
jgi:hypothetical protein